MTLRAMQNCLIVGPSWVGDMIMAQSLYQRLRQQFPQAHMDVLAPAWSAGIVSRMPEIRRIIPAPFSHGALGLRARYRLGQQLRAAQYDVAIVLPNSWKSALVPFFARIPQRRGYRGECRYGLINDMHRLDKKAMPQLVERYAALAGSGPSPRPQLIVQADALNATLTRLELSLDKPVLILCPGAEFGAAKRWPAAHYAAVVRDRYACGWQVWLMGSAKDEPVTTRVRRLSGVPCHNLAGMTALDEAVDLLSCARAVISNDSGLMHVAAAVNVPLIALYGSSDPHYTPPLSPQAHIMRLGLPCSPCFKRECPLGHMDCLYQLLPEDVLARLDAL